MNPIHAAAIFLMCISIWSCSTGNDSATLLDSTGKHPSQWAAATTGGTHPAAYLAGPDRCFECHGSDLRGGISNVSCFSASRSGINCHPGGPSGHPAGYDAPAQHGADAKAAAVGRLGMAFCANCHGADYRGAGSAAKDCIGCHKLSNPATNAPHAPGPWRGGALTHVTTDPSNAAACGVCHRSPAAPASTATGCFNNTLCHGDVGHANDPQPWSAAANHGARAKLNLGSCQSCHATPSSGSNPRFNAPKTGLANGCETCHKPNTAHPTPWLIGRTGTPGNVPNTTSHAAAGNLATACALCHGAAYDGIGGTAPSCMSPAIGGIACHATNPVAQPSGCASCHGLPVSGKHPVHRSFAGVTCASCHSSSGPGTATHANGTINVALSTAYQAKTGGVPALAGGQCSNVSCHGGQLTPPWTTGSINVNTNCTLCHSAGTAQYNSYNSGEHGEHVAAGLVCTDCHDTALLAVNHFTRLDTPAMEGPASATIGGANTAVQSYTPATGSCLPRNTAFPPCHGSRSWQ